MSQRYIALLRGINVGGNHKLPMRDLARIFADCGAENVVTFIQSGNVLFDTEPTEASKLVVKVEDSIQKQFGFPAPIVLRTAEQMDKVCKSNPHLDPSADENKLYVLFLRDRPTQAQIEALDKSKFLPDKFESVGQEIFLLYDVGAGRSKMTSVYFDKVLKTIGTARNWRTTCTLAQLAKA